MPYPRCQSAILQVPDEMARYKQLLFLAAKLPSLSPQFQTSANQVQGCVSKVRAPTCPLPNFARLFVFKPVDFHAFAS